MIDKLRTKLKNEGRSVVWWQKKYLKKMNYQTVMQQLNGFNNIKEETEKAIKKYLEDV